MLAPDPRSLVTLVPSVWGPLGPGGTLRRGQCFVPLRQHFVRVLFPSGDIALACPPGIRGLEPFETLSRVLLRACASRRLVLFLSRSPRSIGGPVLGFPRGLILRISCWRRENMFWVSCFLRTTFWRAFPTRCGRFELGGRCTIACGPNGSLRVHVLSGAIAWVVGPVCSFLREGLLFCATRFV